MVRKQNLVLWGVIGLVLVAILAMPSVLKAIPPRYVARLPEPLQQMAVPEQGPPILPTIAKPVNAASLVATPTLMATSTPPATLTPIMVDGDQATAVVPPTATSTNTPTPTSTPLPRPDTYRLEGVTHKFQDWNNCGPATLAMTLSYFGLTVGQADTAAILKPNPEDRNVSPHEMVDYVNSQTNYKALHRANGDLETIRQLVAHDMPVILEIGIEPPGEFRWMGWYGHYLLVVAYDDEQAQFWVYDSWFGTSEVPLENATSEGRVLTYADVTTYWPHFNRNYIVVYKPEQADTVAQILGDDLDDGLMWQNALADVQAQTAVAPESAFNWFNLGTVYNHLGEYDKAATAYDQALTIGLPWRMLWYQFGPYEAYYHNGRYEDVILLADTTLKDRPYFEESYYYRGLAQAELGNTKEARADLEKAIELNSNFTPAVTALAELGE